MALSFIEELCPTTSNCLGAYSHALVFLKASSYNHKFKPLRVRLTFLVSKENICIE
jgi:hypothetical protein